MAVDFKLLATLSKAVQVYGEDKLIDGAIEEMAELAVAINHHRRGRVGIEAVQEEIADVQLALKELSHIFGVGAVADFFKAKAERFGKRVDEEAAKTLDEKHINKMVHAIGLDHKEPKDGVYEAYRNGVVYNEQVPEWDDLVRGGYAIRKGHDRDIRYHLTKKGFQAVSNAKKLLIRYTSEFEPMNEEKQ